MSKYIPGEKLFAGFAWQDLYFVKFWKLVDDTVSLMAVQRTFGPK